MPMNALVLLNLSSIATAVNGLPDTRSSSALPPRRESKPVSRTNFRLRVRSVTCAQFAQFAQSFSVRVGRWVCERGGNLDEARNLTDDDQLGKRFLFRERRAVDRRDGGRACRWKPWKATAIATRFISRRCVTRRIDAASRSMARRRPECIDGSKKKPLSVRTAVFS
jgi:hypothetical protein